MPDPQQFFAEHGLRRTRQREVIYSALAATCAHPTAEELLAAVRASDPGLSLATVYNTLEALTRSGLCRRIPCQQGAGPCRYDAVTRDHAHLALPDGSVRDVPPDLSDDLLRGVSRDALSELERRMGIRVTGFTLHVEGSPAPDAHAG